ncbi:phage head-tail connector protein [Vagococcus carniphilus]|uniref:phage head-tail connector protein n=1 Tax=Vagococcus carniphilus TaxID=218144 RepID=UPI003BAA2513
MAEVTELEKLKARLGISDDKQDANLKVLLEEAEEDALNYCNRDEVIDGMRSSIRKMAYLAYQMDGKEHITAKSEGGRSESYKDSDGLPSSIKSSLNRYRLGKVKKL